MLSREDALDVIDKAYAARARGDKEDLARYWAEGARFRIAGDGNHLHNVPLQAETPMAAISQLIDKFTFTELQRLEAVVEDNKVAVRWAVNVGFAGRPPVRTEMMDLIHLDDDGKIQSFVQFADTALIRALMESAGAAASA
jgi:ketosteroid isomerase-like protein